MDTTDSEITFDSEGNCNHCREYFERVVAELPEDAAAAKRLEGVFERIKAQGKGKGYDCVLGVSGGVDSTYVAWLAKQYGLRALAVHFDNGWNSELAVDNIKRTVDTLGFDLYTHVVDWEEFRDLQLSFLKSSVPNCEIPTDHAINALLYQVAAKQGVKYILGGGNVRTEAIMPWSWGYTNQDARHLRAIHRRFGNVSLKTTPIVDLGDVAYYIGIRGIRMVPVLNYANYNKFIATEVIQKELGWRKYGAKHYESIFTRFFQGYYLPTKFGFDKRRAHLSCLVCAGEMSRNDALSEMEHDPYAGYRREEDIDFVIKKFGLSRADFDSIMSAEPEQHSAYPSNAWFFIGMKDFKNRLKRIATKV